MFHEGHHFRTTARELGPELVKDEQSIFDTPQKQTTPGTEANGEQALTTSLDSVSLVFDVAVDALSAL